MADSKKPKITLEEAPASDSFASPAVEAPQGEKNAKSAPEASAGRVRDWAASTFPGHANAVLGGLAGLAVAVLVFAIGLLKALFVLFCILVGVAVGQYFDGNPLMVKIIGKLFGENQ